MSGKLGVTKLLVLILSGAVVMLYLHRKLMPIDELTRLSRKMADLEFDEKYSSHVGNQAMMVHSQKFCHILAEQLGWNENHSYRVPGTVFEDQQIARFDLSRANMIQQTNSVPKDPIPQSNTKQSEINNA